MRVAGIRIWLLGGLILGAACLALAQHRGCVFSPGEIAGLRAFGFGAAGAGGHPSDDAAGLVEEAPVPAPYDCLPAPTSKKVVNVQDAPYGAKGDGVADDTLAIQRAVDAVGGTGGTVLVPDGTYLVNAVAQGNMGIRLRSSMTLRLAPGAVLKAMPNASEHYAILAISHVNRVNVVGGTLLGERSSHQGTRGEWGMGIHIGNSDRIVIQGVTAKECWGDGFYVSDLSSNVTLCNVTADHNRRQGLSVTSVDGLVVRNSTFKNTAGTEPECGIDIEPNDGQMVSRVLITGCTLTNNAGGGLQCGSPVQFTRPRILDTVFDRNTVSGNGLNPKGGGYRAAVKVSHSIGNAGITSVSITNNVISRNLGQGILLMEFSADTVVKGNTVTHTKRVEGHPTWTGGGIYISQCPRSTVAGNTVASNDAAGIWLVDKDPTVVISGNTVRGNGGPGIRQAVAAEEAVNRANTVSGNGRKP